MGTFLRALIVEDTPDDAELVAMRLKSEGFDVSWECVERESDYLDALASGPDIILADWSLPQFSGQRALELMHERGLDIPFIIVSGSVGEEAAIEAMRHGAHDYVLKDRPTRLGQSVHRVLEEHRVRQERYQAVVALQASERRYRMLFEGVSEIIFGLSAAGTFAMLNPFFERLTGWPVAEWIGRPFLDLVHPDDHAAVREAWVRLHAGEPTRYPELRILTRSGATAAMDIVAAVRLFDDPGIDVIGFAHDVTARVRAQEEARGRYAELELLHRTSERLLAVTLDPEQIYLTVHEAVAQLMPCDVFAIVLANPAEDVLHAVYLADGEGRWPPRDVPSDGLCGYVMARSGVVQIDDLATDQPFVVRYFGSTRKVRSILAVPIGGDGDIVGMISTQAYEPSAFDARHRLLLETIAAQFAATVRNATLFQQEQARLHELALVSSVSAALRTASTRAEMPAVILDQLLKLLSVEGATFEVLDPATGDVEVELGRGIWASMTGTRIPAGKGLAAGVLATGKPYLNNEARVDAALFAPELFGDCRAAVGVAMVADEAITGLLWIGSRRMLTDHDLRVLTAVADIAANATRRATLNERIQGERRRMAQILEAVPEGVLLVDRSGTVLLANPAAESTLAFMSGGAMPETLTHVADRPLATFLVPHPEGLRHEVEVGDRIFEIDARLIAGEPDETLCVLVVKDVTQERQIRRQQQRQERLAAVGQLAAGMAHDFNNILAVIVLYAHMAQRAVDAAHPVQRWMSIITDQSSQATDLIQQMLDFSRRGDVRREPIDLLALLDQQVRLLQRTLPETIAVTLDHVPGATYTVLGDTTRIQQVVTNLAVNARDAMPDGGRLRISLTPLTVQPDAVPPLPQMAPGEWVCLSVADTGTGMSREVREHLFEPFFTTKEPGKGTGLGLAQVYGIVAQHDGCIDVKTRVGRGTVFTLYLPALMGPQGGPADAEVVEVPTGQGETILVVEDNTTLRGALVATLTHLGYTALEAEDGQAALAQMAAHGDRIVSVLSDVVMPRMGGVALLRALRAQGFDVPVVLLTGHSMDQEYSGLWGEGLSAWLHKPPQPDELAEVLARILRSR